MTDAMTHHSEAEALAAFVDGQLSGDELASVAQHLQSCEECRALIGEAVAFEAEEKQEQREPRRRWMPLAAAAAIAVIAGSAFLPGYARGRKINRELHHVYELLEPGRQFEGRFDDQNTYGKYSAMRGGGDEEDTPEKALAKLRLQDAAQSLIASTENAHSPAALRARAIGQSHAEDFETRKQALPTLKSIPEDKRDAATWNDIAALALDRNADEALAAADHALALQPNMPEALFNRAVALRRLGRRDEAIKAWEQYRAVDPNTPWSAEATRNIRDLRELQ